MEKEKEVFVEQNTVGLIIRYYREKYGLKQSDICEGVCSNIMLSRLETGIREVDSLVCTTLLSRIGQEINQFEIMLDKEDYQNWILRHKLLKKLDANDYDEMESILVEYEKIMKNDNKLQKQFYLYCQIRYMIYKSEDEIIILKTIEEAIAYTNPKRKKQKLYSKIELELMLLYSKYIRKVEEKSKEEVEIDLLELLNYVQNYYAKNQKSKVECIIWEELVVIREEMQDYIGALNYLDKLIENVRQQKSLFSQGDYFYHKIRLEEVIYEENFNINKGIEEAKISYYTYLAANQREKAENVKKYCEEKWKCHVTIPEW